MRELGLFQSKRVKGRSPDQGARDHWPLPRQAGIRTEIQFAGGRQTEKGLTSLGRATAVCPPPFSFFDFPEDYSLPPSLPPGNSCLLPPLIAKRCRKISMNSTAISFLASLWSSAPPWLVETAFPNITSALNSKLWFMRN